MDQIKLDQIKLLKELAEQIANSKPTKKESLEFLVRANILDKDGKFTNHYSNLRKFMEKNKNTDDKKTVDKKIWLREPEKHDYPAAQDYLELLYSEKVVKKLIDKLRKSEMTTKKAKDILRASKLPLLTQDNIHVKKNMEKVANGEKLSPVLLVRGSDLIIADGYHRVCAIYYLSEDFNIPCKLV